MWVQNLYDVSFKLTWCKFETCMGISEIGIYIILNIIITFGISDM